MRSHGRRKAGRNGRKPAKNIDLELAPGQLTQIRTKAISKAQNSTRDKVRTGHVSSSQMVLAKFLAVLA